MRPALISDERGFTLIEMLVATVTGLIVIAAAFAILNISLHQSSRIADRVSADQRSRIAMEKILQELHSSCISIGVNPILPESTGSKIIFYSQSGSSEPFFAYVTKHEISFAGGTLIDASYKSNGGNEGNWKFPGTATSTVSLLTGVSEGSSPVFQYFKYGAGGLLSSTALTTPLSITEAPKTAQVTVSFLAGPDSGNIKEHRQIELSDSVTLRLSPSSESGTNAPCE